MSLDRFLDTIIYACGHETSIRDCLITDFTPFIKIATTLPPPEYVEGRQLIPNFLQAWGNFGKFLDKAKNHYDTQADFQQAVKNLTDAEALLTRWFTHIKHDVKAFVARESDLERAWRAEANFRAHQMLPAAIAAIKEQLMTHFGGAHFVPKRWEDLG